MPGFYNDDPFAEGNIQADSDYYSQVFVGNTVDVARQLQEFCQAMYAQYPNTFCVLSCNMVGTTASCTYIMLYTA